jgi:uncharacterized protein YkwD/uncharacterized membrane protein required for colicin V production
MQISTLSDLIWFDALLLLVVMLSLWAGCRRGLLAGAAEVVALLFSLWLAWALGPALAAWVETQRWPLGVWALPAAVIVAYLLARVLLGALLDRALAALPAQAHRHIGNRLLGLLPGAANGLIHAVLLLMLWQALPLGGSLARSARDSLLAKPLAAPAGWLQDRLAAIFEPAWTEAMRRTTVQPGSRETLALPFSIPDAPARPALEAQMLQLVNQVRGEHGLRPLTADAEATEVARAHSRDMLARGYFSHVSPQGQDPFDRMRQGGLRYRAAGENLALAPNVAVAHRGLMDSPGHRANILRPAFGRLGIGIVDGGRHGLMVTQKFRD